ncbi:hypothetical protein [Roseimaritima sediminicola]|uniref:hypothetical protein n=1 Tax=Roseimaritima sediminicola TaxID=2662066 RepID=UPI0012985630|nr:hypothetical protein [Roseimaritima sediminicola]
MRSETGTRRFDKRTMQQVRADATRALARAMYCPQRSMVEQFRCVDFQPETETSFGRQLWYFDALAVDESQQEMHVYGVIEYSVQYDLYELAEDGVFLDADQRDRFETVYRRQPLRPSWRHPGHRWLLVAMLLVSIGWLTVLLLQKWMP